MENKINQVRIESIDIAGNGIAHIEGKTIFIHDVLPDELVDIEIYQDKKSFARANLVKIVEKSKLRVDPICPHYGVCGGCSLQHLDYSAQIDSKQKVLIDNLKHIGNTLPENILAPISGQAVGYRHKARLSARFVTKKNSVLVGFHEKSSSFIADMQQCTNLPAHISNLIMPLRQMLATLSIYNKLPQVEVAVGDHVSVLVLRIMEPLTVADEEIIKAFVDNVTNQVAIQIWLQPKGPDSCYPFYPSNMPQLSYTLPNFKIEMPFLPTEFTQVNPEINQKMVDLAVQLLEPTANDTVADFFCGIGNFTLPIATLAKKVIGIEGSNQLVQRAMANAAHNNLSHKTSYSMANLFKITSQWLDNLGKIDKWLIDPPRDGALELVKLINSTNAPKRIVYVSCNPATLARDSAILVNLHNYKLKHAGVMNMFPHTSHVESIAVFDMDSSK
ncbi:MAG: 23S rRNA (uracil(1939)-C(5))-methyltransferase RlmD [Burkholderiales bacterium]|nr:23S rRNA (uracil(1939)-C(5))-methyltransferase RlmD [Burkholderiales bacterium]